MALSIDKNISLAKKGNRRELARLLTLIESGKKLPIKEYGNPWVLGVTGPPGVGKSTLIGLMIKKWASRGDKVAVLAIDPSSPKSGGALLGDRMRMTSADIGESVFIRSLATRNHPGGLMPFVDQMITLLTYCGWNKVVIETVGSGQSEIRIVAFANRIMLVDGPDRGDIIQAEKAGIIELADLIVINKSDLPNADSAANSIKNSLELSNTKNTVVMQTSAIDKSGISELIEELDNLEVDKARNILRTKEKLISAWDYKLLSNPDIDEILLDLESGAINLEESLRKF
tara:strand:+ start:1539 stop:2399 length:861 start_codon:yes stop_codon:yes gene_type:complete